MAKLVVINQSVAGTTYELGSSWTTVGRADGNMFQLIEGSVSGRHCEVKVNGEELVVRDLRSTNGTFVGGQKITEGSVKLGQTFRLGNVDIRFEVSAPAAPKIPVITLDAPPAAVKPVPNVSAAPVPAVAPAPVSAKPPEAVPEYTGRKFHVLFVDDSLAFLDSFSSLCTELGRGSWHIYTAPTADRALAILQQHSMDLVVLDIGMPMLDGIQLLGIVNRRYPDLKVAVMTGLANEANRAACLANGAELFLEKPVSHDGTRLAFNMLNDVLQWTQQKGFSGALQHVSLPDVIQLECLNSKSLILDVRNSLAHGQIFIESGRIIHAATGKLTGEKAFQELLSLAGGQFQLQAFRAPPERTVSGPWEFLLMEAARVRDEKSPGAAVHHEPAKSESVKAPAPVKPEPTKPEPPNSEPVKPVPAPTLASAPAPVPVPAPAPVPIAVPPVAAKPEPVKSDERSAQFAVRGENLVMMQGEDKAMPQLNLADVVQLMCLNHESMILDVRSATTSGQIFIESGRIIHAVVGSMTGEGAFLELLAQVGSRIQRQPFHAPPEQSVSGQWEFLLMEAAQVHSEKAPVPVVSPAPAPAKSVEGPTQFVVRGENIVLADGGQKPASGGV